jgi:hypothetical protein
LAWSISPWTTGKIGAKIQPDTGQLSDLGNQKGKTARTLFCIADAIAKLCQVVPKTAKHRSA